MTQGDLGAQIVEAQGHCIDAMIQNDERQAGNQTNQAVLNSLQNAMDSLATAKNIIQNEGT